MQKEGLDSISALGNRRVWRQWPNQVGDSMRSKGRAYGATVRMRRSAMDVTTPCIDGRSSD